MSEKTDEKDTCESCETSRATVTYFGMGLCRDCYLEALESQLDEQSQGVEDQEQNR